MLLISALMMCGHLWICSAEPSAPEEPEAPATRPNLILLVIDDWGFNDVSWHENTDQAMPFLQEHVTNEALTIDTFYTYPLCSISRAALLTGRYPSRYGLHFSVIENGYAFGLSTFETLLPEELKAAGYNTAMVGKWHQGFHRNDMTPLERGFDHFYGSLSPMINFWTYSYAVTGTGLSGYDLWEMDQPAAVDGGEYLTFWERDHFMTTLDALVEDDEDTPFFMYIALHASHYPHSAPDDSLDIATKLSQCSTDEWDPDNVIQCSTRVQVQGQTVCADGVIQEMVTKLKDTATSDGSSVWDNTVLFFLSDNGGAVWELDNSPLRGGKMEIFEGGVRTPAFVSGGYLDDAAKGRVFADGEVPFHITDVMPTFLRLAGVSENERVGRKELDGMDQTAAIQQDLRSPEMREFLYNVVPADKCDNEWCGAYRFGDYKLIWQSNTASNKMWWYDVYAVSKRFNDDGSVNEDYSNFLECPNIPDGVQTEPEYDDDGNLVIACNDSPCLFNIAEDGCEYNDLSGDSEYEALFQYMSLMMQCWFNNQQTALKLQYTTDDEKADPTLRGGFWQPWVRDYDHDDELEDFEDVLSKYAAQSGILEDIRSDPHFVAAQSFKRQWQSQLRLREEAPARKGTALVWIMVAIINVLLIAVFLSQKLCRGRYSAKHLRKSVAAVRSQIDEDEYSPLVH